MCPLPLHYHPLRIGLGFRHSIINRPISLRVAISLHCTTFVKWIHAIVSTLAHYRPQRSIVVGCYVGKSGIGGIHDIWSHIVAPCAAVIEGVHSCLGSEIMGHHSRKARQNGLHAQFALTIKNILGKSHLALVPSIVLHAAPTVDRGSTPAFQIVHSPPSSECRTCHKCLGLGIAVAIFSHTVLLHSEKSTPHFFQSHYLQRHIYAV